MEVCIRVGVLADLLKETSSEADVWQERMDYVGEVLQRSGYFEHLEPDELPDLDSRSTRDCFPSEWIHRLRRVVAHVIEEPNWRAVPPQDDESATADEVYQRQSLIPNSHVICHCEHDGFYVPIDFRPLLGDVQDEMSGGLIGSSYRVFEELIACAASLDISFDGESLSDEQAHRISAASKTDPLRPEKTVWLRLFEAARLSIEHGTAICFRAKS